MSSTNIYILKLQSGKYYVGKTTDLERRKQEHINGTASAWTKKYKPVSVEKIIRNASAFDEDKWTKIYMEKHGVDNVRGAAYSQMELDEAQRETLQREIRSAKDACMKCGRSGHFAKSCYARTDVCETVKNVVITKWDSCKRCGHSFKTGDTCLNCGKTNKKETEEEEEEEDEEEEEEYGCEFCDRTFTTVFGCSVHERTCKEKSTTHYYVKKTTSKKQNACFRCGNMGHYATDCYASRHVKGYSLD
jgi:predicted GIY-YIG superfamily endonuclease